MADKILYKTNYNSPLGNIVLTSDGENLAGLKFGEYDNGILPKEKEDLEIFKLTENWLDRYFDGEKPETSSLPLKLQGSDFRLRVWQIVCEIPYGGVMTYGDIAEIISKERGEGKISPQAVGGAVGHNPLLIVIPCHRVIGSNGNLTGYAGGVELKYKLLKHEGVNVPFCLCKDG